MTQSILLIISGSIAAYKSLDLIRRLRERDIEVRCILTKGGEQFITPLSVASLSGNPCYGDLFSLKDETEMGHIRLAREADLIVVAPASADLIAKMAGGFSDDLATATLLASDKKILVAPAMNVKMWQHPATQRNVKQIAKDGVQLIDPSKGDLACGEVGAGRMAEPDDILKAIINALPKKRKFS
jgi:phosphopantothenoylcysteine decarboxylase/phosphopantothenate--cysteine ligase